MSERGTENHFVAGPVSHWRRAAALTGLWLASAAAQAQIAPAPGAPAMPSAPVASDGTSTAAPPLTLAVRAGATYSDNVYRTPNSPQSDTAAQAGLQLTDAENRPNLKTNISVDADYVHYSVRELGGQVVGGLNGTVQLGFVPERFGWTIQDNFGQTRTNALVVDNPQNRQNVNFVTTGPDLSLPFGGSTSLTAEARGSRATFQDTQADNRQVSGTVGLAEKLGPRSAVSINASAEHVTYDQAQLGEDFDVRSGYLQLDATSHRTTLKAQAGYTTLRDSLGSSHQPLVSVVLSHQLTPHTSLQFDAGSNYSDSAHQFRLTQALNGIALGSNDTLVSTDPLRADHAALAFVAEGPRTTLQLRANWQRERHQEFTELDRRTTVGGLTLTRRVTPSLSLAVAGAYERQQFTLSDSTLTDWSGALTINWRLSRSLSLVAAAGHYGGNSEVTMIGAAPYTYTENRASLLLTYTHTS